MPLGRDFSVGEIRVITGLPIKELIHIGIAREGGQEPIPRERRVVLGFLRESWKNGTLNVYVTGPERRVVFRAPK